MNISTINSGGINRQCFRILVLLAITSVVLILYNTLVNVPSTYFESSERPHRPIKSRENLLENPPEVTESDEELYFDALYDNYTIYATESTKPADTPSELVKPVNLKPTNLILYLYNKFYTNFMDQPISECPKYNNCIIVDGHRNPNKTAFLAASIVVFQSSFQDLKKLPAVDPSIRQKQLWALRSLESPSYKFNRYPRSVNGKFNFTMNYRLDATISAGYGPSFPLQKYETRLPTINYKAQKSSSKGGYAMISNCHSSGFDRLAIIKQLAKYVPIDIYGGCGKKTPCTRKAEPTCEDKHYKDYHFFMAFENSLCKDYITEKFWKRLASDALVIPVAMGGVSLDDYYKVAPPNSFLHIYNFTTVEALGLHMKKLMDNQDAYNSYHHWREEYTLKPNNQDGRIIVSKQTCTLCEYANEMPSMPPIDHLDSWWNDFCK